MGNVGKLQTAALVLTVAAGLMAVVSLILFWRLSSVEQKIAESQARQYRNYVLADGLRQTSDDLTRMARLYAATGEERYRNWFQQILDIRDGSAPRPENYGGIYWDFVVAGENPQARRQLVQVLPGIYWDFAVDRENPPDAASEPLPLQTLLASAGFTEGQLDLLRESEANSNALATLETEAMQAADAGDLERARSILNGADYHESKAVIMRPLAQILDDIEHTAAAETAGYVRQWQTLAVALLAALVLSILLSAGAVAAFIVALRKS